MRQQGLRNQAVDGGFQVAGTRNHAAEMGVQTAGRGIRQQRRFRQKRAFAEVESRDQEAGTRDQTAEIGV